jgi:hypothetical protein
MELCVTEMNHAPKFLSAHVRLIPVGGQQQPESASKASSRKTSQGREQVARPCAVGAVTQTEGQPFAVRSLRHLCAAPECPQSQSTFAVRIAMADIRAQVGHCPW